MTRHGEFFLGGYRFQALMPSGDDEPRQWAIVVAHDGKEVRRETLPMLYPPRFGVDMSDLSALNQRIEEIIAEMGLEG
jgi:hypothetical protein